MSKSIFRSKELKHYTLIHRSQRDPSINDGDSTQGILKQVHRLNDQKRIRRDDQKNKIRQDSEDGSNLMDDQRDRISTKLEEVPSNYNIFYDDLDYDYMQHLRPMGQNPSDSVFIENRKAPGGGHYSSKPQPGSSSTDQSQYPNQAGFLSYRDHLQFSLQSNSAVPDGHLLPINDDPSLREVLDALEDEAYIEDEADDEFFGEIIRQTDHDQKPSHESTPKSSDRQNQRTFDEEDDCGSDCSPGDRPRGGVSSSVKGSIDGSQLSMSSSSMFRNEALTTLDERFERIQQEYESSSSEEDEDSDCDSIDSEGGKSDQTVTTRVRKDFDLIMDEFLDKFEVLGGKLRPTIGSTAEQKLSTIRSELLANSNNSGNSGGGDCLYEEEERRTMKMEILKRFEEQQRADSKAQKKSDGDGYYYFDDQKIGEDCKWDCQSILSTYSNLENHPRLIRIKEAIGQTKDKDKKHKTTVRESKIGIDRVTGFPIVNHDKDTSFKPFKDIEESSSDRDEEEVSNCGNRGIIKRDRSEGLIEKRNRKNLVKLERSMKRQDKKVLKSKFKEEKERQSQRITLNNQQRSTLKLH
ncbi:Low temperature viability protein-domain-containing protein [Phakopsora pachyrhizi]|uniref:Low temperature viability protein-domain-containing protein n=1 Tax=Phakopsora pachyrhizi TaxID=170000 RepID=A0AAV0B7W1_PHAPC|nr:Low temperature viability protein-domain-containing protein [Phakopsora pachyrhizi]